MSKGWDQGDKEKYVGTFSDDCEIVALGMTMRGPKQLAAVYDMFQVAFTENEHAVVNSLEVGNCVAAEVVWTARFTGTFVGPEGEIAPTGKLVEWRICEFDWFEGDRIVKMHAYGDQGELMAQLKGDPTP